MSMPTISINPIDPNIAVANIVASVALLEAGISHVLNAEGEKIEKALDLADADSTITIEQLTELDASVASVLTSIADLEAAIAEKVDALFPSNNSPAVPN